MRNLLLLVSLGFCCACAPTSAPVPDGATAFDAALDTAFDDAELPADASPLADGHFPLDASTDASEGACARACDPHGRCELEAGFAVCRCDVGWTGARCDERAREAYDRVLVSIDLADPAALVLDDGRVLFSGTRGGRTLPLIESRDLRVFAAVGEYDPHAADPAHDYCHVWAPDLSRRDDGYHLYFSAQRVVAGSGCPTSDLDVTTYHARGSTPPAFGAPEPIHAGTSLPRTHPPRACPAEGCRHAIRIDSTSSPEGGEQWFHYVWFSGGNNISAFRWSDPARIIDVAGAGTRFASLLGPDEENINEAPELLERDGRHYLFFSTGWFDSQYALRLLMASSVEELTRARVTRRFSQAPRGASGALLESHGHNSVFERDGEYFNVFHQGVFEGGRLVRRDTYAQRMAFHPDGSPHSLNLVDVRWAALAGHRYSLDLVLRGGSVIGPCIAVGRIGDEAQIRYGGVCPDGGDRLVPKSEIERFRVYYTSGGTFRDFAESEYDGHSDDVFVQLPGGSRPTIPIRWNEMQTGAEYSLDVQRLDGTWVAPCQGAAILGGALGHDYAGRCGSAAADVPLGEVSALRVCSADGGRWDRARCGETEWVAGSERADVTIP